MKKKLISVLCLLLCGLCFVGCRTREDLIPKELGAPEGLWLYLGAERMRTDGSEREKLFTDIELDGETYTEEDYTVADSLYCTDTKTAFFSLYTEAGFYLYIYHYNEKTGAVHGGAHERGNLYESDFYVCYDFGGLNGNIKSLFLRDGTPVCEDMEGYNFTDDILWKYVWHEDGEELTWWRAEEVHSAMLPRCEGGLNCFYDGAFLYHLNEVSGGFSIDIETEQVRKLTYDGTFYQCKSVGHSGWFLTYGKRTESGYANRAGDDIYSSCKLYACINGGAQLLYTFEKTWDVEFSYSGSTEDMIALLKETRRVETDAHQYTYEMSDYAYYYYDITKAQFRKGHVPKEQTEMEQFVCGQYTFWVDSMSYGYPVAGFSGTCYYLYRGYGSKQEIMQYAFDEEYHDIMHSKFFDDICTF